MLFFFISRRCTYEYPKDKHEHRRGKGIGEFVAEGLIIRNMFIHENSFLVLSFPVQPTKSCPLSAVLLTMSLTCLLPLFQLEQFGLEIRDAAPSAMTGLRNRHNCYLAELKRLQEDARAAEIFDSTNTDDFDEIGFDDLAQSKQRLLDNSERLERTGKQLQNGYKIVIETEDMAHQTLRDLSEQRETIQRARSRVSEIKDLGIEREQLLRYI